MSFESRRDRDAMSREKEAGRRRARAAVITLGAVSVVAFVAPGVAPFTWILLVPIGRLLPRIMRAKETTKPDI